MKVNLRRNTMDKEKRPQTSLNSSTNPSSIDEFRLYINNIETLLRDTLNENVKLRQQLNEFSAKKNQIDIRKLQSKADELVKKYSKGKAYLSELEKKIGSSKQINQFLKDFKSPPSNDIQNNTNNQSLIAQYESKLEAALEKYNHISSIRH